MRKHLISPAGFGTAELSEKHSRFIGRVWPMWSEAEARDKIEETRAEHRDARHNPWCYIAGRAERASDDGEPQGTAGQPMLEVFRRESVTNVCCVVTRYFGGVLLGAGGLMRMYVNAAKQALMNAGVSESVLFEGVEWECPYSLLEKAKSAVAAAGGIVESVRYGADIAVSAQIPSDLTQNLIDRLFDISAGETRAERTGKSFYRPRKMD